MTTSKARYCDYCHSFIATGQMWVRQKVHSSGSNSQPEGYLYFHADPFAGDSESCWEKFEMERELLELKCRVC